MDDDVWDILPREGALNAPRKAEFARGCPSLPCPVARARRRLTSERPTTTMPFSFSKGWTGCSTGSSTWST